MRFIIQIAVIVATLTPAIAQQQIKRFSTSTGVVALVGAGATATLQRGAATYNKITLESATVFCSVACTITQSQNGTAATATAGTVQGINPTAFATPSATFWTASNVGSGTSVGSPITCTAACTIELDLSEVVIPMNSTGYNYSITISSITGNYSIGFVHREN